MKIYNIREDLAMLSPYYTLSYEQISNCQTHNNIYLNSGINHRRLFEDEDEKAIIINPYFYAWSIEDEFLKKCKNLKRIYLTTTSNTCVNMDLCKELGIEVVTIPNKTTIDEVATNLIMMMFALAKNFGSYLPDVDGKGSSDRQELSLIGKKVGIVGYGELGSRIAEFCKNNSMEVFYHDKHEETKEYPLISKKRIFSECDVIFVTVPDNEDIMIEDEHIHRMGVRCSMKDKKQILISASRTFFFNPYLAVEMTRKREIFGLGIMNPDVPLVKGRKMEPFDRTFGVKRNVILMDQYAWFVKSSKAKRDDLLYEMLLRDFPELSAPVQ